MAQDCSSDPQLPAADARQGALAAPALGPIDEADDLAILGVSDGLPPGHVGLVVAVLTRAHDEPDQLRLGRESLTVAGGVAEQETGQLCLGVERPILGETMVEDHDVVHGALLLLDGCGSLWHSPGDRQKTAAVYQRLDNASWAGSRNVMRPRR